MKTKGSLIFDLDGTLWCASTPIAKGWNDTFKDFSINKCVTPKDIESVAGNPFHKCVEVLFSDLDLSKYPGFLDRLGENERFHMENEGGTPYPEVLNGLERLKESYSLFIVSNCSSWYLDMFLDPFKLRNIFTDWDCFGLSSVAKDIMIKRIVDKHQLHQAFYIGDTSGDEKASLLAKLPFIHMEYGYGKPESKPYASFKDFSSFVSFFDANSSNF